MAATILDGTALAERIGAETAAKVAALVERGLRPHLVAIQLGEPAASKIYTRRQAEACEAVGVAYELKILPPDIEQADLIGYIEKQNRRDDVTGIIVQLPLPAHVKTRKVHNALVPHKDVEGMHSINYGLLFSDSSHVAPCTALAAVELVRSTGVDLAGQEAVIVGHSEIVGKPIAMILLQSSTSAPTVTVCHVATRDLAFHTRRADILFVATGVPQHRWEKYWYAVSRGQSPKPPDLSSLITADMVKPGAIVVDVAINRIPVGFDDAGKPLRAANGSIRMQTTGDVDFDAVKDVAGWITPVPGGVGPVTVQMLLRNTVECASWQAAHR
ncbi:MAG: bifunctional methylenetetrahydrofolate dehydrogenase/methenyltetrahydrofolate cyclohydrolase [Planctomycetes bacterium]|nr:bifunctional methylenetetrahydrofolate dehydrogenase/methenyltetrahydrofolate cyclohydrolase [Planctomycetota bacterium]